MSVNESVPSTFASPFQGGFGLTSLCDKPFTAWNNTDAGAVSEPLKEDLLKFVEMVNSDDKPSQLQGLIAIRKLLSLKENPPIQEIIDSGVGPKLLEFMKWDDEPNFQYESAWAVTNICSGTSQDVEYIVELGGLDIIINLLNSTSAEVLDQAVWALGNVAGDNTTYRNMCLDRDAMEKLVQVFQKFFDNPSIKRNTVWAMSNLLRGKPVPQWNQIAKGLPILKQVLAETHFGEALIDALWGVSWTSELYIQEIIELGCVPYLVHHLKNNQLSVLIPALRALGNIVTGNDLQTNAVLSCSDFLSRVFELTSNTKKTVRKEACWLISNIAAGNHSQIALILDHSHYVEALKKALVEDSPEVVTEAAWALGNLASGATPGQIAKMVNEYSYIRCLSVMLENKSPKVKQIGLEATLNVLNSSTEGENPYVELINNEDLISKVEAILNQENTNLYNLAEDILAFFEETGSAGSKSDVKAKEVTGDKNEEKEEPEEEEEVENEEDEDEDDEEEEDEGENENEKEDEDEEKYVNLERED